MFIKARAQMHANDYIVARQASQTTRNNGATPSATGSSSTTSTTRISQPSSFIPLTTIFTPPASCSENRLSQIVSPAYLIWANEPVPAANHTSSACYPKEFLRAYQYVPSGTVGSSVVPAMSPMAGCPANYCTALVGGDDHRYVVCCPSKYTLHTQDTAIISNRPGYGGTCYSDFSLSSTYSVTAINEEGGTNLVNFIASTTPAQAFAHPIDGFVASSATLGCPNTSTLPSLASNSISASPISTTSSAAAAIPPASNSVSGGVIAGATVGGVVGLAIIVTAVWRLLFYRRRRRRDATAPPIEIGNASEYSPRELDSKHENVFEKETSSAHELSGRNSKITYGAIDEGPFEMGGDEVPELSSGADGKTMSESERFKYNLKS